MDNALPLAAQIGRERIAAVVHAHYQRLLSDPLLKGHFGHIDNMPEHEARVADFWWSAMGGCNPDPRPAAMEEAHRPLGLTGPELERWLQLLRESLDEQLSASEAEPWLGLAEAIGGHMRRASLIQ